MAAAEPIGSKKSEKWIPRGLRCEIVKPLDIDWDELGPKLRTIRSIVHRLYTASALAAIRVDRAEMKNVPERDAAGKPLHPKTAAYQAVSEELADIRAWATKKKLGPLSELELPGGMKAAISAAAYSGFQRWRSDKGKTRVPTWKHGAPIPVRAQESSLEVDASGKLILTVKLTSVGRIRLGVIAGKGAQWERLRALATGAPGVKRGDAKIIYSVEKKKWFAIITYSELAPEHPAACDPDVTLIVHRGERNFLTWADTKGGWDVLATGEKLRAFKRRMRARRRSYQSVRRAERGDGAHGHGRGRRYETPDKITEAEQNFVKTLCQQMGARVAELARVRGAGRILIEEFDGMPDFEERGERMYRERFPYAELKKAIEWSLKKIGLELEEYEAANISRTCPMCGHLNDHPTRTRIYHCDGCRFERPVDFVGAIHALRKACDGWAGEEHEKRLKFEKQLDEQLRSPP